MKMQSIGGLFKALPLSAVIAIAAGSTSATSADLGGDCCADLEERIAELEATTARKGNRKVSLTVSGHVAEQLFFWDDGVESNTYVTGLGVNIYSQFHITGSAKITSDVSAGYKVIIGVEDVDPLFANQDSDDARGNQLILSQNYMWIESAKLGRLSWGFQNHASDNAALLTDASGTGFPASWIIYEGASFFINNSAGVRLSNGAGSSLTWANDFAYCATDEVDGADCAGVQTNSIKYTSPNIAGFQILASWGEDDLVDGTLNYSGVWGSFKVLGSVSYAQVTDENYVVSTPGTKKDVGYLQLGGYVEHMPTGLFVHGAYGREYVDGTEGIARVAAGVDDEPDHYYLKAGIRRKWTPLGMTVLYGEYGKYNDMISPTAVALGYTDSELQRWGVGIWQDIDAAAMSLFANYSNLSLDTKLGGVDVDVQDFHAVKAGGIIWF
ncbi:MAG: porin [Hyphomicrobiaceae bacterium]|nr:porin [Hyphomicrobiaceae bacterium]